MKKKLAAVMKKAKPTAVASHTKLKTFASGAVFEIPLENKSLFVKVHRPSHQQDQQEESGRILFVSNIAKEESSSLTPLFESLFNIQVSKLEQGEQRVALVYFTSSVENKLKHLTCETTRKLRLSYHQSKDDGMVNEWLNSYSQIRTSRMALAEAADLAVVEMEQATALALDKQNKAPIVDDDGFTMVVSKKKDVVMTAVKKLPVPKSSKKRVKPSSNTSVVTEQDSLKFYKFERKRLRKESQIRLKDQFKLDQQKAERIKTELLLQQQ
ncbi:hypothetical protein BASA81_005581 [Batrachochytrium salamandrivorans]|nr:hypothetical protein BASA81_005581 [Batrachochytrium salamandrivorans]